MKEKEFSAVVVGEKLERMGQRLQRLRRFQALTLDAYLQDEDIQSITERLLEQIIQSALDINRAFLKRIAGIAFEGKGAPSNSETFILAGQHGLISPALGERLSKSGGFRNVLAHSYDQLIAEKVFEALQIALGNYPQYLVEVNNYLNSLEQTDAEEGSE